MAHETDAPRAGFSPAERYLFIAGVAAGVVALAFTLWSAAAGAIAPTGTGTLP